MITNKSNDYFSIPQQKRMRDVMDELAAGTKAAIRHLLSLGIIKFDTNLSENQYAYHWTEFGKAVLGKLNEWIL